MLWHSSKDAAPETQQTPGGATKHWENAAVAPRPLEGYFICTAPLHRTLYTPAEFNVYDSLSASLKTLYSAVGQGGSYQNTLRTDFS